MRSTVSFSSQVKVRVSREHIQTRFERVSLYLSPRRKLKYLKTHIDNTIRHIPVACEGSQPALRPIPENSFLIIGHVLVRAAEAICQARWVISARNADLPQITRGLPLMQEPARARKKLSTIHLYLPVVSRPDQRSPLLRRQVAGHAEQRLAPRLVSPIIKINAAPRAVASGRLRFPPRGETVTRKQEKSSEQLRLPGYAAGDADVSYLPSINDDLPVETAAAIS